MKCVDGHDMLRRVPPIAIQDATQHLRDRWSEAA